MPRKYELSIESVRAKFPKTSSRISRQSRLMDMIGKDQWKKNNLEVKIRSNQKELGIINSLLKNDPEYERRKPNLQRQRQLTKEYRQKKWKERQEEKNPSTETTETTTETTESVEPSETVDIEEDLSDISIVD